ncbi:hypothetical protein GCM10010923_25290 [Blastomonas marina]|uniref:Uncharacterized protein n=2 Tax=Bacteria TaxID=2 RepID=A0ABQ1H0S1_9BACL|nr:hypothetical protein GCM10010923_25290 [Blastomonas marina]GGA53701.1 hypothetical protein GCM10010917_43480 [Paenibacillus physcomitrellae]GGJ33469.1 hypothetical protein GCM10008022_47690 [Paenibacillus hunanensis]
MSGAGAHFAYMSNAYISKLRLVYFLQCKSKKNTNTNEYYLNTFFNRNFRFRIK